MKNIVINKLLLFCLVIGIPMKSFAEKDEVKNQEEMLSEIHLEKKQVEKLVEKMVKSGRLSEEESVKVKREIASIKESDFEDLKSQVVKSIRTSSK